ncbi:hypothetical protein BGW41_002965 [Actinomortierella wolfii]|nr:hypothetical protein BGW41_002965 [Actinomortierella wolfii]
MGSLVSKVADQGVDTGKDGAHDANLHYLSWESRSLMKSVSAKYSELERYSLRQVIQQVHREHTQRSTASGSQDKAKDGPKPSLPFMIDEEAFVNLLRIPTDGCEASKLFFRSFCNLSIYPDRLDTSSPQAQTLGVRDFLKPLAFYCHKLPDKSPTEANSIRAIFESFAEIPSPSSVAQSADADEPTDAVSDGITNNDAQGDGKVKQSSVVEDSPVALPEDVDWNPEDDLFSSQGPKVKAMDMVHVIAGTLWLLQVAASESSSTTAKPLASITQCMEQAVKRVQDMIVYSRTDAHIHDPIDLTGESIDFVMFSKYANRNLANIFEILSPFFYNLFLIGNTMKPTAAEHRAGKSVVVQGAEKKLMFPETAIEVPVATLGNSTSDILTPDTLALLSTFVPLKDLRRSVPMTCLYSGNLHGFSMNQFELHVCKYPAPTLFLIHVERHSDPAKESKSSNDIASSATTMKRRTSISFENLSARHRHSISTGTSPSLSKTPTWGLDTRRTSIDRASTISSGSIRSPPASSGSTDAPLQTGLDTDTPAPHPETPPPQSTTITSSAPRLSIDDIHSSPKPQSRSKQRMILGAYVTETWKASKSGWGNESCMLFELSPEFEVFPARKNGTTASAPSSTKSHSYGSSPPTSNNGRNVRLQAIPTTPFQQQRHFVHFLKNVGIGFGGQETESCMMFLDDNLRYGTFRQDFATGSNIYMNSGGYRRAGYEIDFEIVECEVWGLGGQEAKARQQKEWDFEHREANRRASIHIRSKDGEQEIDRDLLEKEGEDASDNPIQEMPGYIQEQQGAKRGGRRRKHSRITAAFVLATVGAILTLNVAKALPLNEVRHQPIIHFDRRQDTSPSPLLPGTTDDKGQGAGDGGDPCTALSKVLEPEITYELVKACFENIPFNQTEANSILTTLYTFYKDFYIFVDSAQQPLLQKPFTSPPVDILAELRLLGQRTFANDFEFHREVDLVINKLNDAHANYMPACYQHYLYIQPFDLYAPVINGVQTVKILNDNYSPDSKAYQDCTVLTIDGEDALSHIQKWVDTHYAFSKDAGVRLNKAMTQLIFSTDKMDWVYYSGQFSTRATLPERANMQFTIQCDGKQGGGGGALKHTPGTDINITDHSNDDNNKDKIEEKHKTEGQDDGDDDQPAGHQIAQVVDGEHDKQKQQQQHNVETLSIPWQIYRLVSWRDFVDTPSFIQANCLPLPPEPKKTEPLPEQNEQNDSDDDENDDDTNDDDDSLLEKLKEEFEKDKEKVEEELEKVIEEILEETNGNAAIPSRSKASQISTNRRVKRSPLKSRSVSDLQGRYYAESLSRQSRNTILERRQDTDSPITLQPNVRAARLIFNSTSTAFFQLVKRPEIGVVVIPTHMVDHEKETKGLTEGFELLHKIGVQKVILDLTSNGGGYVSFAYDLVDWMFPNENITSVYESDMRASMSIKALADQDLYDDEYDGYFNPSSFSDPQTKQVHETNFFLNDRLERRVRSPLGYTDRVLMNHELGKFELGMPWQHHAQDMVVLTDGSCGSACGMSLNRLKNRHGVASYAIGGRAHEDLSLFSFAGASVYGLDDLITDFETLKVDSPLRRMRYRGIYRVPVMEFFQENDPVPIEFHPSLYKADFHLDYTPETARHHEKFWEIIADNHWKH